MKSIYIKIWTWATAGLNPIEGWWKWLWEEVTQFLASGLDLNLTRTVKKFWFHSDFGIVGYEVRKRRILLQLKAVRRAIFELVISLAGFIIPQYLEPLAE